MENRDKLNIGDAAKMLGVSIDTLRRRDASGELRALRSAGGHRYYDRETLERYMRNMYAMALLWAESAVAPDLPSEDYCETQDRFWARQNVLAILLDKDSATHDLAPLLASIVGEIGNNCFEHNIGNWPDVQGICFAYDLNKREIVIADRGLGIRATLSRVRPSIKDDIEAMTIAMTERVSGRAPEQRGNGLKYVRKVAGENPIGVSLRSGTAVATIAKDDGELLIDLADRNVRGTIAKIIY
jgi:excisionase family DNA binding protein